MANPAVGIAAPRARSMRWPVVALLTAGVIIAYVDRVNLSSAIPVMRKTLGLSPEQSGELLSAFFWSYALLQIPAGWVVDRFGVKWPYAVAFFLWSIISASTALMSTFATLLAIRVLLGVGESIVTPAAMSYIGANFAEKQRGLAVGIYMSGTKYGPAIGAPIAAYLVRDYGWQLMFVATGLASLVWLIPWVLLTRDDRPSPAPGPRPASGSQRLAPGFSWRAILLSPVLWGTFLATFCYMYFVYFCMTWMVTYFKDRHGLSLTSSGWYTFMSFGGMATIAIIAGWAADRVIARGHRPAAVRRGFTIAGFVLASTVVVGALARSEAVAMFFAVFSLCGLGLATANYWALTQTLMPAAAIGRVAGIQNTAANLAGVAAPWVTGWMIQRTHNFDAPLLAVGFWLAIGVGCYLFLVREKYAPQSQ